MRYITKHIILGVPEGKKVTYHLYIYVLSIHIGHKPPICDTHFNDLLVLVCACSILSYNYSMLCYLRIVSIYIIKKW